VSPPPTDPNDGDRFLVGASATGDWSGWDNSTVDTTVMEKNIAHPTDARLYEAARRRLVRLARTAGAAGYQVPAQLLARRDRLPWDRRAARQRTRARQAASAARPVGQAADRPICLSQPGAQPRRWWRHPLEGPRRRRLRHRHDEPRTGGVRGGGAQSRVPRFRSTIAYRSDFLSHLSQNVRLPSRISRRIEVP